VRDPNPNPNPARLRGNQPSSPNPAKPSGTASTVATPAMNSSGALSFMKKPEAPESSAAGSRGSLREGATIPLSRTTVTTDFDQVVNTLQPDVRQNLQVIFIELGTASDNRGTDMNQAFASLSAASDNMKTVTAILQNREPDTTAIVVSSEKFNRDVQNAPIAANIADTNRVQVLTKPLSQAISQA